MIRSTFRHSLLTQVDNSRIWELFSTLRKRGYKVSHEFSRILPGNKLTFDCYPYPEPNDLELIKSTIFDLEHKQKRTPK